jgi:hypothetical protein
MLVFHYAETYKRGNIENKFFCLDYVSRLHLQIGWFMLGTSEPINRHQVEHVGLLAKLEGSIELCSSSAWSSRTNSISFFLSFWHLEYYLQYSIIKHLDHQRF